MHLHARCRRPRLPLRAALLSVCLASLPLGCAKPPDPIVNLTETAPAPTGERLPLGFGWPAGFRARVTGAESRRLGAGLARDETRTELSYRVTLEPAPGGARIRYDDFALPDSRANGLVRLTSVPGLEPLTAALQPSFLVSQDGRFAGTPDLDEVVLSINRELAALHARPQGLPPGAPLLPTRFSAELFRRHAPVEWWPLVELWAGREIELGARYQLSLMTRLPLLEGVSIRMDGELQVSGRVPCDAGGSGPARCIELVLISRPDPLALAPLLEGGRAGRESGADAATTLASLELDESVRLVTEPETLVPHRVATSRRARLALRLADGSLHTDALDQELDLVFHPEI